MICIILTLKYVFLLILIILEIVQIKQHVQDGIMNKKDDEIQRVKMEIIDTQKNLALRMFKIHFKQFFFKIVINLFGNGIYHASYCLDCFAFF